MKDAVDSIEDFVGLVRTEIGLPIGPGDAGRGLDELPEKYREVLILRDVRELNIEETAQLLGISIGMVKTRLFRARLMMQKIVAPELRA